MSENYKVFKVLVIGDSNVGKTALVSRYVDKSYSATSATVETHVKFLELKVDGERVKLAIWDTAGTERYRNVNQSYYSGAHGAVVVYDVKNKDSFKTGVPYWINCLNEQCKNVDKILVGTKADRVRRKVLVKEALQFANDFNMKLYQTSAKHDKNIDQAFVQLTKQMLRAERERRAQEREDAASASQKQIRLKNESVRVKGSFIVNFDFLKWW